MGKRALKYTMWRGLSAAQIDLARRRTAHIVQEARDMTLSAMLANAYLQGIADTAAAQKGGG